MTLYHVFAGHTHLAPHIGISIMHHTLPQLWYCKYPIIIMHDTTFSHHCNVQPRYFSHRKHHSRGFVADNPSDEATLLQCAHQWIVENGEASHLHDGKSSSFTHAQKELAVTFASLFRTACCWTHVDASNWRFSSLKTDSLLYFPLLSPLNVPLLARKSFL